MFTLFSFPLKRAIGAGAFFNLVISLPATIVFSLSITKPTAGRSMRWAMSRCFALRPYHSPRSLSRLRRLDGRHARQSRFYGACLLFAWPSSQHG